ncbi:MAG: hypothetical protein IPL12_09160 [Bacteroidetes bacterium]|nr:hypothetical protein [Bacteroidota bacterium]
MQKFTLALILSLFVIGSSQAQTSTANKKSAVYFGMGFGLGFPFGEFKTFNDEVAPGGAFSLYFQPDKKIPVLIGFDMAILGNGHRSQTETLTAEITAGGTVIDVLYFPLRAETNNLITKGNVNLRVQAPTNIFKPYIDGLVGFNHFGTTTSIYDESEEYYFSEEDNPLITSSSQNSSWAFSYGGAVGLMVGINESLFIDLRFAYTLGSTAEYFVEDDIDQWDIEFSNTFVSEGDIDESDISIAAVPKESKTDMMVGTIGVSFKF